MKTINSSFYYSAKSIMLELSNIFSTLKTSNQKLGAFTTVPIYEDVKVSFLGMVFSKKTRQHVTSSYTWFTNAFDDSKIQLGLDKLHGIIIHGINSKLHNDAIRELTTDTQINDVVQLLLNKVSFKRDWDSDDFLGHERAYEELKDKYSPETLCVFVRKHKDLIRRFLAIQSLATKNKTPKLLLGVKAHVDIATGMTAVMVAIDSSLMLYDGLLSPTNAIISMWLFDNLNDIEAPVSMAMKIDPERVLQALGK